MGKVGSGLWVQARAWQPSMVQPLPSLLQEAPSVAGVCVHSPLVQQPAVGTQRFVFKQFRDPILQLMPHLPAVQTAAPFDGGARHGAQVGPQKLMLVSD